MKGVNILAILLISVAVSLPAVASKKPKPAPGPLIQGYGDVQPMPKASAQPDVYKTHKVVFDLCTGGDATKINEGLVAVAQAVNAFSVSGVSKSNLKFVVVIHGAATPVVIEGGGYQTRFNTANPNLDLIGKLSDAGVQLVVDGQSLAENKITSAEVSSHVDTVLSAATALVVYAEHKYVVVTP